MLQIPAGATGSQTQTYTGLATPAECTVVEDPDGHTDTVSVTKARSGASVTVPPGGAPTVTVTDTYTRVPGDLVVNKTITGGGAGRQGQIVISVTCDDGVTRPDFVIAAGTPAGTVQQRYTGIPNGTVCHVAETADGSSPAVSVTTVGGVQDVTIPVGGSATADITDTYELQPGQLTVTKTIAGPGAGQQGEVEIRVFCDGVGQLQPAFVVPAGTPAGSTSQTFTGIPGDTTCTVVEGEDGGDSVVVPDVDGGLQRVAVPAGGTATAQVTDTYALQPGSLAVRKVIGGEAAPLRGEITIEVACDDGVTRDPFVIPRARGRSGDVVKVYSEIPAGTTCTVTETADGSTRTATVVVEGSGQQATIPAGGAVTADLTDTFSFAPGDLVIGKRITGPAAGRQGRIVLRPVCDGVALPPFVIPTGHQAGLVLHTYTGIPAGAQCTGTETPNGSNGRAAGVITVQGPLPKRVLPGVATRAVVTDRFFPAATSVTVHKTVTGPDADRRGPIVITTTCGDTPLPDLVIAPSAPAGTTTKTYHGIAPGTECTVQETQDGHTSTVAVHATGNGQVVRAPVIGSQHVYLTDSFHAGTAPAVLSPAPTLPNTGGPALGWLAFALGCLMSGSGLLILSRRRR